MLCLMKKFLAQKIWKSKTQDDDLKIYKNNYRK